MPADTILQAKLFAPPLRRNMVPRPRLMAKLSGVVQPGIRLTLVCAPAGFGKTTLVAEWLAGASTDPRADPDAGGLHSSWITLDETDNDPVRFWRYLVTALQGIDSRLGASVRPALDAPQAPPIRTLLVDLANDVQAAGREIVLVCDDYHLIEREEIHAGVNFLLDHLPPGAHLVFTTRSDPPLELTRRRARGELLEVRAADLRFTREEAARFINETMRLGLSAEDTNALEARTEGWIAGLQMAAISLQDAADPHAFVAAFRGDDRYVADYLLAEVLQRQPVEFQQFMLQTAVLDRLCGPLCDAVTGRSDSQALLNALERANLFLIPLDNRREWFRYHPLFASLLRRRLLDASGADAVLDLKRRASRWHAGNGNIVESVELALSAGDYEQAIAVIEGAGNLLFKGAELNTLRGWTERIPEEVVAAHPKLNLMATWGSHATGYPAQAERFVQVLEHAMGATVEEFLGNSPSSREYSAFERSALLEAGAVRARIAVDSLELEKAVSLAERILPQLIHRPGEPFAFNPPENLRGPMLFEMGLAYEIQGNLAEAARLFAAAETDARERRNPHILALAIGHLGKVQILQGNAPRAQAAFERAGKAEKPFPPDSSAFWGLAAIGLGELELEAGDLGPAERHFRAGVETGKIWNTWECMLPGMIGLARIHAARGEWWEAFAALDELEERTAASALMVRPAVEAERAALRLRQGDLAAALAWAASFDAEHPAVYRLQWEQNALTAAQIRRAAGRRAEADALLERLRTDAQAAGRLQTVERIRRLRGETPPAPINPPALAGPVEPLSEREVEVLRRMAEGLSNPEIARRLHLSPNTLKAHSRNIYRKLDAHNRMEAVNKARELKIIP
jgi:LuxR family maltose regulon positive regulatory protein